MKKKLCLFAVATMAAATLIGCGNTINPNKYVTVDVSGYEGYGKVDVKWDEEALAKDFADLEYAEGTSGMRLWYGSPIGYVVDYCLDYEIEKPDNLKNGDKVTITWEVDEGALADTNAKVNASDMTITVKGLEEVQTFDAFAGLNIEFSGLSPFGKAKLENIASDDQPAHKLSYSADKTSGLKNGDTITVTVKYADNFNYMIDLMGGMPESATKTFTVSGLSEYADEMADIPADLMEKMDKQARDSFTSQVASYYNDPSEVKGIEYVGSYFIAPKDPNNADVQNRIDLVYKVTAYSKSADANFDYYWLCGFRNIVVLEDGTVSVNLSEPVIPKKTSSWGSVSGTVFRYPDNGLYYIGYKTIDDVFFDRITKNVANFNYETTIK